MKQNQKVSSILTIAGLFAILPFVQGNAFAATPDFGMLYYDGEIVRTIVPPSETKKGLDDLFLVVDGDGNPIQTPIAAVAPGDKNYHGGHWIVSTVQFKMGVTPYLLTSDDDVIGNNDLIVTKTDVSFLCPIQPSRG